MLVLEVGGHKGEAPLEIGEHALHGRRPLLVGAATILDGVFCRILQQISFSVDAVNKASQVREYIQTQDITLTHKAS